MTDQEAYDELSLYTLAHHDPEFIHQYIVDAYAAQHATEGSKPIYLAFALAGLYLHNEKGFSGKKVQEAHTKLAKYKERLPHFSILSNTGSVTVHDVLKVPPGDERDQAIRDWSASVWAAYKDQHAKVADWVDKIVI
jgi:Family of unknown function (DUF5946)